MNALFQIVPGTSIVSLLLNGALALGLPAAATWLAMQVSKLAPTIDAWPDWEKRVAVLVWGLIMTGLSHALNIQLPQEIAGLHAGEVQYALSTGLAFLLHRIIKGPAPTTP